MTIVLVTPPTSDPISLAEAKAQCRVSIADEDGLIAGYILAARQHVEDYLGRRMLTQTVDYKMDRFKHCIEVPIGKVQSIVSISYVGPDGASLTLSSADYLADVDSEICRISSAYGKSWPVARDQMNAVTVRAVVGYGTSPGDVPEPVRQGMLLHVELLYDRDPGERETLERARDALLRPHRVYY